MIIKGIDLANELSLVGSVNILKKELTILDGDREDINKYIYGIPATDILFRRYRFPFKDFNKIKKALEGNLKLDLPIDFENVVYRYIYRELKDEMDIFCFVVKRDIIEELQSSNSVIDTEILALLRVAKWEGIFKGEILHFNKNYTLKIVFNDLFPEEIRILNKDTKFEISEDTYLSGFIPSDFNNYKIIGKNIDKTELNVAYGLLLNPIDNLAVDFSLKGSNEYIKNALKGSLYLTLAISVFNLAILFGIFVKNKELKKVKSAEKEIFIKYFSSSGEVYEPLTQAKGLLKLIKSGKGKVNIDPIVLLSQIGVAKRNSRIVDLQKLDIYENGFIIQGIANSLSDIDRFKGFISKKYKVSIEETNKLSSGKIRFVLRGSI